MRTLTQRTFSAIILALLAVSLTASLAQDSPQTPPAAAKTPRKLALLVGISTYERGKAQPPDWWNLNCQTDVDQMKQVLIDKFGFQAADIHVLTTRAETTHQGIKDAFKKYLIDQAQPGDVVWFHYSGHGQQVPEAIPGQHIDGLDSSFIPSDYINQSAKTTNNLRGTELGALLTQLAGKRPASVTVSVDCCFAGAATRGAPPHGRLRERGRGWNTEIDGPKPRGGDLTKSTTGIPAPTATGNVILLSATRNDQTAKEKTNDKNQGMGAFTYYLVQELQKVAANTTYSELFERIQADMSGDITDETPQADGNLNQPLLGGIPVAPNAVYVTVKPGDADTVTLGAGQLQGLSVGSRFAIFPAGTTDFKNQEAKLAEATVTDLTITTATASLTQPFRGKIKPDQLKAARAVEVSHNYSDHALKVVAQGLSGTPAGQDIQKSIQALPIVQMAAPSSKDWDVRIRLDTPAARGGNGGSTVVAERQDGSTLTTVPLNDQAGSQIGLALENDWKWRFVNLMKNTSADSPLKVDVRIVPVTPLDPKNTSYQDKPLTTVGGNMVLHQGDYFMLELRNQGTDGSEAYVTVLDLRPDGTIGPMWPYPGVKIQDNKIVADNTWHRIPLPFIFKATPPFGREVFKAIATPDPADFSLVISQAQRGGPEPKEAQSPIGKLLRSVVRTQRSELAGQSVDPVSWATAEYPVEVKSATNRGIPANSKI